MLESDDPRTPSQSPPPSTDGGSTEQAAVAAQPPRKAARPRKTAAKKVATDGGEPAAAVTGAAAPAEAAAPAPRRRAAKKAAPEPVPAGEAAPSATAAADTAAEAPRRRRPSRAKAATPPTAEADALSSAEPATSAEPAEPAAPAAPAAPGVVFVAPAPTAAPTRRRRVATAPAGPPSAHDADVEPAISPPVAPAGDEQEAQDEVAAEAVEEPEEVREVAAEEATGARRRRRRRRGRGGRAREDGDEASAEASDEGEAADAEDEEHDEEAAEEEHTAGPSRRRRRRRRRSGEAADDVTEPVEAADEVPTVVHVRESRPKDEGDDGVRGVKGSTRLEAKRQRRRDGRDSGRRRPPILTEAEFLARRESVERVMAVRELGDRTQIAVLEDGMLVEHYVTRASTASYVGNVYLGRVQNVLPSMEAAFVDIGKGRNGVLYAGEVNWDAAGLEGKSRAIESALNSGDTVLVQVTKDPIAHKGARLTSQISLPGRFLVYVPGGAMTGISRKLPDTERHRLKAILKKIVPEDAGVIVRTAAEGASEQELTHDVERLKAQWQKIEASAKQTKNPPTLVHGEPDLAIRVVRDVFNEDFKQLLVQGADAWQTVSGYLNDVAPDLADRISRHSGESDLFHDLRIDEQLAKALDRKVYLPSGGSLVIDRTEAMTVIDVNTGKFVGAGGNLEQTVTRNNIEAAEEVVRQLRLRDVGGIIVIDFIDMVLESNRELVLRRLTECLGRDRTKHQVAEVTSLGLVQMTRKRVGEGLLEAFSEPCPTCSGRGLIVHCEPVDKRRDEAVGAEKAPARKAKRGRKAAETEEPALNEEQRKAAADAMAVIAGVLHHDADADADDADALADGGPPGVEITSVPDLGEAVSGLAAGATAATSGADGATGVTEPAPDGVGELSPDADQTGAPPHAPTPRRGRRRAASRPAGPPATADT